MPIAPCFDPSTGASGGAAPGGATPPALTVTGRANKAAYTITSGARAFSISNPDGATLLTTVTLSTDGSSVIVNDNASTTPSYTAAAGGASGLAYEVTVTATKGGAVSQVSFTEAVDSTGLLSVQPTRVNLTDGTWTLYDPDAQVNTVTYDSLTGQHTVTMNDGGSSSDYNPGAGSVFRGARWYKLLTVSGTQVTSADWLNVEFINQPGTTVSDFVQRNFFATTTEPTSTTNSAVAGLQLLGSCWSAANGLEQGTCVGNSFLITSDARQETQRVTSMRGNDFIGMAAMMSLRTGTGGTRPSSANQRFTDSPTATDGNIYLVVGIGIKTNTTVITAGNQCFFGLQYIAHTVDSGAF